MKTWQQHLDLLTQTSVVSANRAIDYLVGDQIKHIEDILSDENRGITKWQSRGVEPVMNNLTKKIVDRSAKSYSKDPERLVFTGDTESPTDTERYDDILAGEGNEFIDSLDAYSRLLKVSLMLVQYVEETGEYSFSVLHRGNCDVDYNRKLKTIESLIYTAEAPGASGGKMFHHWTPTTITDIEVDQGIGRVVSTEDNPYSIVPVAVLRDIGKPVTGFWPNDAWDELIRLNEVVNMFCTEWRFASKYQTFPSTVTNANIKNDQVAGVDSIVKIDTAAVGEAAVFYELSSPTVNLDQFKEAVADLIEEVADNWGVKLEVGGTATADSGFQLIVQENNSLETRQKRIKSAKSFEIDLFRVVSTIEEALSLTLNTSMEIATDFAEPALAVDVKTEREADRLDFAAGLITKKDWLKKWNPDMTEAELNERTTEGTVPNFDDQVTN